MSVPDLAPDDDDDYTYPYIGGDIVTLPNTYSQMGC